MISYTSSVNKNDSFCAFYSNYAYFPSNLSVFSQIIQVDTLDILLSIVISLFSCYIHFMSITQTVTVPDSHQLTINVPCEIPAGRVILTFTPYGKDKGEFEDLLSASNSTLAFWDNKDDEIWDNV